MIPIRILNDGRWQDFHKSIVIIGSEETADVYVPKAAKRHAYIMSFDDRVELLPTGANVYINDGMTLASHIRIRSGDCISLGREHIPLEVVLPHGHMDTKPVEEVFVNLFQRWNALPPLIRAGHGMSLLRFVASSFTTDLDRYKQTGLHRRHAVESLFNDAVNLTAEFAHLLIAAADFDAGARGIDADVVGGDAALKNFLEFIKTYTPQRFE